MDDLFVKRPGQRRASNGSDGADGKSGARRMVREMVDIVLDESPEKETLSLDEQRLRKAGGGASRTSPDEDSWADALEEASRVHDEGFVDGGGFAANQEAMVDGLFARRREPAANQIGSSGDGPKPMQRHTEADDLFFRKVKKAEEPEITVEQVDEDEEEDEAEEDLDASGSQVAKHRSRCCRMLSHLCRGLPFCACDSCERNLPSRAIIMKFGIGTLIVASVLAVVTVGLATGCDSEAPFGKFCFAEGPVQWVIAFSPVAVFAICFFVLCRRNYKVKEAVKQASWQHDTEAQRSAAELLDTLAVAPAVERHKYSAQAVQVLKDFPDKAVIQYKGCAALEAICRAQKGNVQHVHGAGAVPVILQALEQHLRVRKVQTAGLSSLACLAKISKQQIFEHGGIETILRSMTKFKRDPAVQVSGAMALGALCLSSVQNRKSVARFGGVSVLLQALERHIERADVIIAASETLSLIGQDSTGLQKQLLSSLPVIQSIAERYEEAKRNIAAGGGGSRADKRAKDCEVVLRSLRKLEGRLADLAEVDEDDAASDVATPRLDPNQEGATVVHTNVNQSAELHGRLNKWKK